MENDLRRWMRVVEGHIGNLKSVPLADTAKNEISGADRSGTYIASMSPDDYIALARRRTGGTPPLPNNLGGNMDNLRASIEKHGLQTLPWLSIDGDRIVGQEGLHRAVVLKDMGYERLPVRIFAVRGRDHLDQDEAKAAYHEILSEKAIRIDADGHPITVIENPSIQQLLSLLERSPDEQVKGLIIGSEVYFWSATSVATHGHIAQKLWPTDEKRNYWEYPEYVDGRLLIELDDGHPTLDFEPALLDNPRILALLKSDRLYFHFPGAGFMNYSEYLWNDQENEKRRIARQSGSKVTEIRSEPKPEKTFKVAWGRNQREHLGTDTFKAPNERSARRQMLRSLDDRFFSNHGMRILYAYEIDPETGKEIGSAAPQ